MMLEMTCQPRHGGKKRRPGLTTLLAIVLGGLTTAALPAAQESVPGPADLLAAVRADDVAATDRLLTAGANPDASQGDGATALHWAAHRDNLNMVTRLVEAGANVDAKDDHGVTPLSLACLNGSVPVAEALLEAGADANLGQVTGITPLMTAARVGNIDVIRLLLTHGAEASASERSQGQTALMWAIAENHTAVARLLVEVGAGVSARTRGGFTPLLFAAQQGNVEVADVLLEAGADVNEAAPDGIGGDTNARARYKDDTEAHALMVAIDSGHAEMALFLLERGADPTHDGAGRTPLHSAVQQAMRDVIQKLLARGADPNARLESRLPLLSRYIQLDNGLAPSPIGATPFWLASSYADTDTMQLLLDGGADPTLRSADGTTPLMVAAGADFVEGQNKYGRRWFGDATPLQESALEAVALLLDLDADVNATNEDGQTALHGAVYLGGTILVPYLLERGADINAINHRGQTPWMIAARGEYRAGSFYTHTETGDVLEALGADMTLGGDLGKDFAKVLAAADTNSTSQR